MRVLKILSPVFLCLLVVGSVSAQMTGVNYRIDSDSFGSGGDNTSSGSTYEVRDSIGGGAMGIGIGSTYELRSGLRPMIFDQIIILDVVAQETSTSTTVLGLSGTDITLLSSASFSVGDHVFLVQDVGSSPVSALGKVTAIVGNTVTVDELVSSGGISIDGSDDRLYRATGTAIDFGDLSATSIVHRLVGWGVSADVPNGFQGYVVEDGNLRSGADDVDDVSDGEVSVGSEEYGARSSDTSLSASTFDTVDTALTTSPEQVGSEAGTGFAKKGFLDLRAAISLGTTDGTYAHSLTFTVAPTY